MPKSSVLVDTGVFSAALSPGSANLIEKYGEDLADRKLLISFQTAAEIRYGALVRRWGPRRIQDLEEHLARATEVPPHAALTREWAIVRNECRQEGHAFQAKVHSADLWVAATAIVLELPLVTHDSGFRGVPRLDLICRV